MSRILVVDDIPDNVKLLTYDLQDMGHEVDVAYSGPEALEIAEALRPDCILLDVMMPIMDGYQVCRRLKCNPALRHIPVIMISAGNSADDIIAGLDAGADDYVSKPFNVRIVESRVRSALRVKELHDERMAATRQLEEAKRIAEAANRSKSDFLSNMSHEIRTPMTAILGFAQILADNVSLPENLEAVATITRNGEHLLEVLNDILDLSKIEAGKLEVELIACRPTDVIDDVASLMQVRADIKGIALEIEYTGEVPEVVQTDPTRLRQVLLNLVGNAIKFTSSGSVRLVTQLIQDDSQARLLQFDVIDSGIGMSEAETATMFQPFTQADTSTTRKFGGTGLGLAISRRLARMLGGDITVACEAGEGCLFRLTIATGPLGDAMRPESAVTTSQQKAPSRDSTDKTPKKLNCRILLAEDGPDNQRLISFILKKAGAEVTIAENGQVAIEIIESAITEEQPFDVILMDMQMPVLDGYGATRQLRNSGYDRPIIALTAHAMSSDRAKCLAVGCDEYATKPVNREELLDLIRRTAIDCQTTPAVP